MGARSRLQELRQLLARVTARRSRTEDVPIESDTSEDAIRRAGEIVQKHGLDHLRRKP